MHSDDTPFSSRPKPAVANLYLIVMVFLCVGLLQFGASRLQADILSAVRAYVAGEGLWSKAQKNGVQNLFRYAATGDAAYYAAFQQELTVPLGDMQARVELQRPQPDLARAYQGFIAGGNHPDDVAGMAWLFRNFGGLPQMASAIAIWTEADQEIARLRRLAERLHDTISTGQDAAGVAAVVLELERSNQRLTVLAGRFSAALGEAARWVATVSTAVSALFTAVLLLGGALLVWRLVRSVGQAGQALARSEAQFRRLADSNILGVCFWHADGTVLDANDAFLQMLGYRRETLAARLVDWRAFTPPEYQTQADKVLAELAGKGVCPAFETVWQHRDGRRIPVLVGAALLDGHSDRGVAYAQDLSERKHREEELRLAATVLEESSEAIVITDARNKIVRVNRAFSAVTGYSADEVLGMDPGLMKSGRHSADFYRAMWQSLNDTGCWRGEIWDRRKSGELYPKWLNITVIRNARGEVSHYAAIFSDVTAQKADQERIRYLAEHDQLTGLPNRMLLRDRLGQALAYSERFGGQLALMFVDLDHFKSINDSHGHHVGDELLRTVAQRLVACVRRSDTVSRHGGDEFVVMLAGACSRDDVEEVARRMLESIAQDLVIAGQTIRISPSIGIAVYPGDGTDEAMLLGHADTAMYRVKQDGRNGYRFFSADIA